MCNLNPSQEVFALFYAIMWGSLANVWPRWKAFDWTLVFKKGDGVITLRRVTLSIVVLNALPILFFIIALHRLDHWRLEGGWWCIGIKLFIIMLQPFAIVGFYWLWVSIVQLFKATFYPVPLTSAYRTLSENEEHDLGREWATPNLVFGLLYIVGPHVALRVLEHLAP
jgi:hypothetical protein